METFTRFLYEFLNQFFSGFIGMFKGIGEGFAQAFNFKRYQEILNNYNKKTKIINCKIDLVIWKLNYKKLLRLCK